MARSKRQEALGRMSANAMARAAKDEAQAVKYAAAMCAGCPADGSTACDDCADWLWSLESDGMVHSDEPMFGRQVNGMGLCIE